LPGGEKFEPDIPVKEIIIEEENWEEIEEEEGWKPQRIIKVNK